MERVIFVNLCKSCIIFEESDNIENTGRCAQKIPIQTCIFLGFLKAAIGEIILKITLNTNNAKNLNDNSMKLTETI